MKEKKWSLMAGTHDENYVVHAFNLPDWIAFGGPNQDINANIWAYGYPALLEAAEAQSRGHECDCARCIALYDAIKEAQQ